MNARYGFVFTPLAMALVLVASGCSKSTSPTPPSGPAAPTGLVGGVTGGGTIVNLRWNHSTDHAASGFRGYYVYANSATLVGATDAALIAARITPTPLADTTSILSWPSPTATTLYFSVRAVRTATGSDSLSAASNESTLHQ